MVGIGKGMGDDLPGLLPRNVVGIHEDTHQFRNRQSRMGIVELNDDLVGKVV